MAKKGLCIAGPYWFGFGAGATRWLFSRHPVGALGRSRVYGATVERYLAAATLTFGSAGSAPASGTVAGMQPPSAEAVNATARSPRLKLNCFPATDRTAANFAPNCARMSFP